LLKSNQRLNTLPALADTKASNPFLIAKYTKGDKSAKCGSVEHPSCNQIKSTKLNLGNNYTLGERTNNGCPVQLVQMTQSLHRYSQIHPLFEPPFTLF
jgi:hypothetical protein